ncbi:hypothetical protein A3B63_00480 [Candidatus Saccharibacteria bacterium RIFCSPLOWO2_01_FULL_49_22]|nr:MAG: hypothetical protein A3B63_00480 [Candidatus Saccharibacteria bacterium RIFCSPLOWO2_01_FULL_49_22]
MRALVLYHPNSEHSGQVEDYARDFKRFKGKDLELVSLETREGAHLAELYDVVRYPAVLVIGPDGVMQKIWEAPLMPLMDEVNSYVYDYNRDLARAQLLTISPLNS